MTLMRLITIKYFNRLTALKYTLWYLGYYMGVPCTARIQAETVNLRFFVRQTSGSCRAVKSLGMRDRSWPPLPVHIGRIMSHRVLTLA
jgi:hypothetical protein